MSNKQIALQTYTEFQWLIDYLYKSNVLIDIDYLSDKMGFLFDSTVNTVIKHMSWDNEHDGEFNYVYDCLISGIVFDEMVEARVEPIRLYKSKFDNEEIEEIHYPYNPDEYIIE